MSHADDLSPATLRAALSPVSERFAAIALGDAVVIFDRDEPDRWIYSDDARERTAWR